MSLAPMIGASGAPQKTQPCEKKGVVVYVQAPMIIEGEMRFLQKIKFLPNIIFILGTFRHVLSYVKYKISSKNSIGKVIIFCLLSSNFTSDWTSDRTSD